MKNHKSSIKGVPAAAVGLCRVPRKALHCSATACPALPIPNAIRRLRPTTQDYSVFRKIIFFRYATPAIELCDLSTELLQKKHPLFPEGVIS